MKRQCLLCLLALFASMWVNAQNISVKSFRLLETDLTANFQETQEIDQNGEVAALIKVITTETGFMFDVGALGIVKQVQKPGEIWLYVPHGVQRININHQKLGRLEDPYYFSIPIQQARTYELVLTASRVKTIVEEDAGGGFLSLTVTPPTATVFVDDNIQALDAEGTLSLFLLYGEHTYRVEAPGYRPETGKVEFVIEETKVIEVTLQEQSKSSITFTTPMTDAEIWLNNKQIGTGEWTGGLNAGTYIVETRKAGHRPQRTTITVTDGENRTISLEAPIPMVGRLRAESKPTGADVFLGEKNLGRTPSIFNDVLVGTHTLTFRKEGYAKQTTEVTVEEGKVIPVSVQLTRDAKASAEEAAKQQVKEEEKVHRDAEKQEHADRKTESVARQTEKAKKASTTPLFRKTGFYVDAHIGVSSPMGAGASVGTYLGGFNIEGSYDIALSSGTDVVWYKLDSSSGAYSSLTMIYSPSSLLGGSVGYGIQVGNRLRLTPRVGTNVLAINGKGSETQKTYVMSGTASIKMEFAVSRLLSLYVAPAYNLPVQRGSTADRLKDSVSEFAKWNSGLSVRAGLSLNF